MTQDTEDVVARLEYEARLNPSHPTKSRQACVDGLALIQSLSDRIDVLTQALRRIESGECVTDWADQPHEQMQDEARAALHQEGTAP